MKQNPFVIFVTVFSLLICLLLGGCGSRSGTLSQLPTPLEQNEALWHAQGIHSYRYTLQISSFIAPPATGPAVIEVRDDKTVSITPANPALTFLSSAFNSYSTIDKLFAVIADAQAQNAATITVNYEAALGYPTFTFIDYSATIADDELSFSVTNFTPL